MTKRIHPLAGGMALLIILVFWLSTALVELRGDEAAITLVKTAIPWGFLVLIPALALTGISGMRLARLQDGPLLRAKRRRMPFVAANGVLILVPAAFYLAMKARAGEFDTGFAFVQAVELAAGAVNIVLLSLNMRDGLRLTGRLPRRCGSTRRRAPGRPLLTLDLLIAALALLALGSGVGTALIGDAPLRATLLSLHAPLGVAILSLVLLQVGRFLAGRRSAVVVRSRVVRTGSAILLGMFYLVLAGMAASGIGMMVLSGAHEVLLGPGNAPLPNFWELAPRLPHAIGARLLVPLLVLLAAGALYRNLIRRSENTRGRPSVRFQEPVPGHGAKANDGGGRPYSRDLSPRGVAMNSPGARENKANVSG